MPTAAASPSRQSRAASRRWPSSTRRTGTSEREIPLPGVDEIFNPTLGAGRPLDCVHGHGARAHRLCRHRSPTSGTLTPLTRDAFADLQPAWSPDGQRIAFATDRFSSQLDVLDIGPYRLALHRSRDGRDRRRSAPSRAARTSTRSGRRTARSLYFISDRDGISNLYRVTLDGERDARSPTSAPA